MPTQTMPLADAPPDVFATAVLQVTPHRYQAQWLRSQGSRVRVACCGRRWGKSWSESVDLIWFAVRYPETVQFLVAPTHDQSQIIFRQVETLLRNSPIAGAVDKVVYSPFPEVKLNNGSVIRARSAGVDGANIRGHHADRIILDEAAFIPDAVYPVLTPMMLTSKHQQLVLISTPFGKNSFWDYYSKGEHGEAGYISFQFPSETNPHIDRDYLEEQRRDMTELQFAVEYGATFRDDQNSLFSHALITRCLRDDLLRGPLPGHRYVVGYDPAKYADRSGVVVLDTTELPHRVVYIDDISGRDFLIQAPQVVALSEKYNNAQVLLDSTHDKTLLEYLQKNGLGNRATGFDFTNASKQELLNGLVLAMERAQLEIPHHRDLITELTYYRYELTAAGNVKMGADPKHHDDLVTALALAVQSGRQQPANVSPGMLTRESPWASLSGADYGVF